MAMKIYNLTKLDYVIVDLARTTSVKSEGLWETELIMETYKGGKWVSVLPKKTFLYKGLWLNRTREQLGPISIRIKGNIGTSPYSSWIMRVSYPDYTIQEVPAEPIIDSE
jgi:hypothetical protein